MHQHHNGDQHRECRERNTGPSKDVSNVHEGDPLSGAEVMWGGIVTHPIYGALAVAKSSLS